MTHPRRVSRAISIGLMLVAAPFASAQTTGSGKGQAAGAAGRGTVTTQGSSGQPATGSDAAAGHPTDKAASAISGGVPALRGITPSRAELPASAFTKLDANQRGYLTRGDVGQLEGFESAFRQGDRNGDGRLDPAEFNTAWGIYSGTAR